MRRKARNLRPIVGASGARFHLGQESRHRPCPRIACARRAADRRACWAESGNHPARVLLVNTREGFRSAEDARTPLKRYLSEARIALPTLIDENGSVHRRFGGGLPLAVVMDRDGRVAGTLGGFDPEIEKTVRKRILFLLDAGLARSR